MYVRSPKANPRGHTAQARLGALKGLEYYQERRLRSLNLTPIETEEEIEALREESMRAAGRRFGADDYEW